MFKVKKFGKLKLTKVTISFFGKPSKFGAFLLIYKALEEICVDTKL